jgi:hypothetical protein
MMTVARDGVRSRMDHFKEVLKRSGVKLTHQRLEIFRMSRHYHFVCMK